MRVAKSAHVSHVWSARRALSVAALVAAVALHAACDGSPSEPNLRPWSATLAAIDGQPEISGEAAILAGTSAFAAAITIADAPVDAVYDWVVAEGSCSDGGSVLGDEADYPALEVDEDGEAAAEAHVGERLENGEPYHVLVSTQGEDAAPVACGALEMQ